MMSGRNALYALPLSEEGQTRVAHVTWNSQLGTHIARCTTMRKLSEFVVSQDGSRTLDEAMDEVRREIEVRRRIYDRWIQEGKLSRTEAQDRMCRMLSALRFLIEYDTTALQLMEARKLIGSLKTPSSDMAVLPDESPLDTQRQAG